MKRLMKSFEKANYQKKSEKETQNVFLILKGTTFFYTKTSILLHENIFGNMITTPYPSI